jgi:hypothetical protein
MMMMMMMMIMTTTTNKDVPVLFKLSTMPWKRIGGVEV